MAPDLAWQMLAGNESLAVDFGIGMIAWIAAICWLWAGITGRPCSGRGFWITFVLAALFLASQKNAVFFGGQAIRTLFLNVAIPAMGWASFLVLVLLAGAVLGILFSRYEARKVLGERHDADTLPSVGERIQPALTQARVAMLPSQPEPARATRQTTAIAVKRGEHVR